MKAVFDFLSQLKENNHREWFLDNKKAYEAAKSEFQDFVAKLIHGIGQFDQAISHVKPSQCIFRINRDVRFSKEKHPYKTNFGAAISADGKKTLGALYYIHAEPGQSFMAGGIYMPDSAMLSKIRQEIDYNTAEFKQIIQQESFRKTFGDLAGERLKTAPKGYPKDHPEIGLLVFKSYIVSKPLDDRVFRESASIDRIIHDYQVLYPFNQFLTRAIE